MGKLKDLLNIGGKPRCRSRHSCGSRCALDGDHRGRHYCGKHGNYFQRGFVMDIYETTETGQTYLRTESVRREDFDTYAAYLDALRCE